MNLELLKEWVSADLVPCHSLWPHTVVTLIIDLYKMDQIDIWLPSKLFEK